METKIAEIIFELLNSSRIKDKLLGMQLASIFDKKKKTEDQIIRIQEKLLNKYLEMINPDLARDMMNNLIELRGIANFIYKSTFWYLGDDDNFHFNGETLERTDEGYIIDTPMKQRFFENFTNELNLINKIIIERNNLRALPPEIKEGENEKLVYLIREVVFSKPEELKELKRIYRK